MNRDEIFLAINQERDRQDEKWGEQNHNPLFWLGILMEEMGEVAKAIRVFVSECLGQLIKLVQKGMRIMFDGLFGNVEFDAKNHTYRLNGRKLRNVTGLVKEVKPPFEADYWAGKKAEERGISAEEIKAEWDAKREASMKLGTEVHEYIAQRLRGEFTADDPILGLNDIHPQGVQFDRIWTELGKDCEVVKVEWVIGDETWGIAGTADCLVFNEKTGQYHIFDWKTGSKFNRENRFQQLLEPFEDLDDCELNEYSLQLSLYRLIVERKAEVELGDSYLVYLMPTGYQIHQAKDLRERCEEWIKSGIMD